eukprot:1958396-Rhodomonas_salina.3
MERLAQLRVDLSHHLNIPVLLAASVSDLFSFGCMMCVLCPVSCVLRIESSVLCRVSHVLSMRRCPWLRVIVRGCDCCQYVSRLSPSCNASIMTPFSQRLNRWPLGSARGISD